MSNSPDELLTVYDVADRLKVNQQTVRNWIESGSLAGMRLGARRVRVRSSDLEQFIAESSSARAPAESTARERFESALTDVQTAGNDDALAAALRRLSRASLNLARSVSHH